MFANTSGGGGRVIGRRRAPRRAAFRGAELLEPRCLLCGTGLSAGPRRLAGLEALLGKVRPSPALVRGADIMALSDRSGRGLPVPGLAISPPRPAGPAFAPPKPTAAPPRPVPVRVPAPVSAASPRPAASASASASHPSPAAPIALSAPPRGAAPLVVSPTASAPSPAPGPDASPAPDTPVAVAPLPLTVSFVSGVEGVSYLSAAGPVDSSRGGQVALGSGPALVPSAGSRALDSDFHLGLGVMGPDGLFAGPWLDVTGHLTGSVAAPGVDSHASGGFAGSATSAVVRGAAPGEAVPTALRDLADHPGRVRVSGVVAGGYFANLTSRLTIDPPADTAAGPGASGGPSTGG